MSKATFASEPDFVRTFKKAVLSSFVILTFSAYALHEHLSGAADGPVVVSQPNVVAVAPAPRGAPAGSSGPSRSGAAPLGPGQPSPTPATRQAPGAAPTLSPGSQFKDGEFTGSPMNAFWGNVQVKAVIRSGRLSDVQFVDYPRDRRTSQRINDFAIPVLKSEVLQKQSASVDIISGATLTSEAFMRSLQTALSKAKA